MDGSQGAKQGSQPHLAATFYPGGVDDFYIPEVVSPAPQRLVLKIILLLYGFRSAPPLTEFRNQIKA